MPKGSLRICENGHRYYKSSDCPTCPVCEAQRKPDAGFLSELSTPACRALVSEGIDTLKKLSTYSKKDILKLHGMGPASIPKLERALNSRKLSFRKD